MWIVTPAARRTKNARRAQCSATKIAQLRRVTQIKVIETTFTWSGIALWRVKFRIYFPNLGWFISQSYKHLLPRRNSAADKRRSGVVGNTGRKIPRTPNPSDKSPRIVSNNFISGPRITDCCLQ